jgi:hypothetical protein
MWCGGGSGQSLKSQINVVRVGMDQCLVLDDLTATDKGVRGHGNREIRT